MSYVSEMFESATRAWKLDMKQEPKARRNSVNHTFQDGLRRGFEVALRAYGIYQDGRQVIGCTNTPIVEIIAKECGKLAKTVLV